MSRGRQTYEMASPTPPSPLTHPPQVLWAILPTPTGPMSSATPTGWAAPCARAGPSRGGGSWGWLDQGRGTCTDLPRIPTEIHLFVLKQREKEEQAGPGTVCQQMA